MAERHRGTENFSLPRAKRVRKKLEITLSDEARERLEELAKIRGEKLSRTVEHLVMTARASKK